MSYPFISEGPKKVCKKGQLSDGSIFLWLTPLSQENVEFLNV